jgi:acetyl-CoA C-acetyltransferase
VEPIYIVSGVRTAIGDFGGGLKDFAPTDLAARVTAEAIRRANLSADAVDHVVMGQVIATEPKDAYLARVAAVNAGVSVRTPAFTLNRLCGSGLQAVISAAQLIAVGDAEVAVAGGAEVMSRSPHLLPALRFGQKMGSVSLVDAMVGVLSDPFEDIHMGVTAENVAARFNITREEQDRLAAESHRRAVRAQEEGRFDAQILPLEVRTRRGMTTFERDEHVRADVTEESLSGLKPAFQREGSVTAGNASGINDGAAALILASAKAVTEYNLSPKARILGWGYAGVEPAVMGIGPVDAVPAALSKAALSLGEIDVIESNEAFAAQACAVARSLAFDPEKVNPNGSGISLGHPIGATGAILTVKAIYELERSAGRYGLITMCIGGGQGIAMVIERVAAS